MNEYEHYKELMKDHERKRVLLDSQLRPEYSRKLAWGDTMFEVILFPIIIVVIFSPVVAMWYLTTWYFALLILMVIGYLITRIT